MINIDEQILELLSRGYKSSEIAYRLKISVSYIEKRMPIIKDVYNAKTLFELGYKFARNEK